MDALLKRLTRVGLRRGLGGEHWSWLLLAGAAFFLRRSRRAEDASTTLELAPGERYLVSLVEPGERRRGRRREARARVVESGTVGEALVDILEGTGRGWGNGSAGTGPIDSPAGATTPAAD